MKFKISIEQDEDGFFTATCPSLPGCISQGKSEKLAIKNMKEAIELHLETLSEDGLPLQGTGRGKKFWFLLPYEQAPDSIR